MAHPDFHPVVSAWFHQRFGGPTPPQEEAWPAIRQGRHTLVAAPTGSGKTLAAFLVTLDDLIRESLGASACGAMVDAPGAVENAPGSTGETPGSAGDGATASLEEAHGLPDEVRTIYVSPLKALSADIHENLAVPRREMRRLAGELGYPLPGVRAAVRTGDTPSGERTAMLRRPPHILVTTPESLYLLLTAERSREMLRTVRTVIVDEIHALIESRRGAHLALSLERLQHVAEAPLQRIGLSATQRPIEEVARFLVGSGNVDQEGRPDCAVVDRGHRRELDLALEVPPSPLEPVASGEQWEEIYDRVAGLARDHETTLVFANTRRLAERVTRHLEERLGEDRVATHHGSLSKETRQRTEARLRDGDLDVVVATASLELGIDIGHVDLVIQLGTPRRVSTFVQRVGRSGHTLRTTPRGRLFPLTRDELVECSALLRAVRRGELDRLHVPDHPLDVLAQQVAAETAAEEWEEEELHRAFTAAWPYRSLSREEFGEVTETLATGFTVKRGRRSALVHRDRVNGRVRGRRGTRLLALTAGGAIPDHPDYRVVLEPQGTFIGTVEEDFAVESMAGDVFQLGNRSWRVLRIQGGVLRVEDAGAEPPNIPFWLGEAPARSDELSAAVSELRGDVDALLAEGEASGTGAPDGARAHPDVAPDGAAANGAEAVPSPEARPGVRRAAAWLQEEVGIPGSAAEQLAAYLAESRRLLGRVPTQRTLALERFFDDSGGMQLILHAPFGSRVNRAWGLALRKRFCRTFNFELQAAATDEGILLSLGPQHSFPLETVYRYLEPSAVGDVLTQAVLDSPFFEVRWRWVGNLSLAVPRARGGSQVPPQIQRMQADDLLAAVFPDAAACLENIGGDRAVPEHPLVRQALDDCLHEAMDLPRLQAILADVRAERLELLARDLPEPSPLAAELLNARAYSFLDDGELEERRTQAVYARRATEPTSADDLGALDADAIAAVRAEAWPSLESAEELHDGLVLAGFMTEGELPVEARRHAEELESAGKLLRTGRRHAPSGREGEVEGVVSAAERAPEVAALWTGTAPRHAGGPDGAPAAADGHRPRTASAPASAAPAEAAPTREDALRELVRGRLEVLGPVTVEALAEPFPASRAEVEAALAALEGEGTAMRGYFTPGGTREEWCDRALLARIHRRTLHRLRAEIEPVSSADFMRFLLRWQGVEPGERAQGAEGLAGVLEQLDGLELPAVAWELEVLPQRCQGYEPELLDELSLQGRTGWGRLWVGAEENGERGALQRTSPVALFLRENGGHWLELAGSAPRGPSGAAAQVASFLAERGASFFQDLVAGTGLLRTQVEEALAELAAAGLVSSDGVAGLRALVTPSDRRPPPRGGRRRGRVSPYSVDRGGRWELLRPLREGDAGSRAGAGPDGNGFWEAAGPDGDGARPPDPGVGPAGGEGAATAVEAFAHTLLRRYGVVFHRLAGREPGAPRWRELVRVYRRLEARGEIRGGRFVAGMSGEQFALPEAVGMLRKVRREEPRGELLGLSAADPLNLTGVLPPTERIPAMVGNRVVYRDGVPVAARVAGEIRRLAGAEEDDDALSAESRALGAALSRPRPSPSLRTLEKGLKI